MTGVGKCFRGRSTIITGGASGIGQAIGRQLQGLGAHVVVADVDYTDDGQDTDASRSTGGAGSGDSLRRVRLDVRDRDGFKALVADVASDRGGVDFLFNNAGISLGGPTVDMPDDYWDRVIDVNIGGVVNGVIAALPVMIDQGHGHIVNTASAAGLLPAAFVAAYSLTKHAVVGLTGALRPEVASLGVRVSVLCPGMVDTPILDRGPPVDLPEPRGVALTGRAYLEAMGMKPMSADRFATAALRGIARNRAVIVAPAAIRAGWMAGRLSPSMMGLVNRVGARRVRRAMTELSESQAD